MSVGIFDSDFAMQIRAEFETALARGASVFAAADGLRQKYAEGNTMILYLALAALQLEHAATVHLRIKKQALTLIVSGDAAEPWVDDAALLEARQKVLQELRQKLLALE